MKLLARIIRKAALILSLSLCAGMTTLWILSYWRTDYFYYQPISGFSPRAISQRGAIQWKLVDYFYPSRTSGWNHYSIKFPIFDFGRSNDRWDEGKGQRFFFMETGSGTFFYAGIQRSPRRQYTFHVNTPHAFFVVLTALPPLILLIKRFRQKKLPTGLCTACGYDLRATPDRCPECGQRPLSQN